MRFGLLGPIRVFDGERAIQVPGTKRRTILAALPLNPNSVVSLDQLANLLWAQQPPASATASLYNHVNRVRRELGEGAARITAVNPGYRIRIEPGELDSQMFAAGCAYAATEPGRSTTTPPRSPRRAGARRPSSFSSRPWP